MLAAHPENLDLSINFLGKTMRTPIWVSSMTGGTGVAQTINRNIARVCREFGMGMGLGSCRKIIFDKTHWNDFNFRDEIGEQPFWANLGVAQIEELLASKNIQAVVDMVGELRADGLIVHVNPLQEWFQPEGNRLKQSPLQTIQQLLTQVDFKIIVKEVGLKVYGNYLLFRSKPSNSALMAEPTLPNWKCCAMTSKNSKPICRLRLSANQPIKWLIQSIKS